MGANKTTYDIFLWIWEWITSDAFQNKFLLVWRLTAIHSKFYLGGWLWLTSGGVRTWTGSYTLLPFLQFTKKQETDNVCNFLYYGSMFLQMQNLHYQGCYLVLSEVLYTRTALLHFFLNSTRSNNKSVLLTDFVKTIIVSYVKLNKLTRPRFVSCY